MSEIYVVFDFDSAINEVLDNINDLISEVKEVASEDTIKKGK